MNYSEILSTLGITQGRLETIIIFTVIAIGIGIICILYWKFLLAGIFGLLILFIFAHHEPTVAKDTMVQDSPVVSVEVPKVDPEQDKYMKDCLSLTGKQNMCEELWNENQKP